MLEDATREVMISSVSFGDGIIEVSYFEANDQSERAGLLKTLIIDRSIIRSDVDDILSMLQDVVDEGLLEIRNPARSLDPRKRLTQKEDEFEEAV